jgi:hypothetical protein
MVATNQWPLNKREGRERRAGRGRVIAAVGKARTEVAVFQLSAGTAEDLASYLLAGVSEIAAMLYPSLRDSPR